jgi:hypothetical protein
MLCFIYVTRLPVKIHVTYKYFHGHYLRPTLQFRGLPAEAIFLFSFIKLTMVSFL